MEQIKGTDFSQLNRDNMNEVTFEEGGAKPGEREPGRIGGPVLRDQVLAPVRKPLTAII